MEKSQIVPIFTELAPSELASISGGKTNVRIGGGGGGGGIGGGGGGGGIGGGGGGGGGKPGQPGKPGKYRKLTTAERKALNQGINDVNQAIDQVLMNLADLF